MLPDHLRRPSRDDRGVLHSYVFRDRNRNAERAAESNRELVRDAELQQREFEFAIRIRRKPAGGWTIATAQGQGRIDAGTIRQHASPNAEWRIEYAECLVRNGVVRRAHREVVEIMMNASTGARRSSAFRIIVSLNPRIIEIVSGAAALG